MAFIIIIWSEISLWRCLTLPQLVGLSCSVCPVFMSMHSGPIKGPDFRTVLSSAYVTIPMSGVEGGSLDM